MIFLSALPDDPYFIWQIEIQLNNFSQMGITSSAIHILIGYNIRKKINSEFIDFASKFSHFANFYFYPDERVSSAYIPSIRPHIIKQHFRKYKNLRNETIFYHDSDIVFTYDIPNFDMMDKDDIWYFSNTRPYLGIQYIKDKGRSILDELCSVIGIDKKIIIQNDNNAGGAQALIKNVDYSFWDKIEKDSERIYLHLQNHLDRYYRNFLRRVSSKDSESNYSPITSWCADMWALLWNSYVTATVKVHKELDFCWPHERSEAWMGAKIFHNAGVEYRDSNKMFYKGNYINIKPFDEDFSFISKKVCSYNYISLIENISDQKSYDLSDCTFIFILRIDSEDRLENITATLNYVINHFKTKVLLLEADIKRRLLENMIPSGIEYFYLYDDSPILLFEKYTNYLVNYSKTNIIVKYDSDIIVPPAQLYDSVISVRYDDSKICYPYDGRFIRISGALRTEFIKTLDIKILTKYIILSKRTHVSYGGCCIVNKDAFISMGMDNINFKGWGFEDQELYKRGRIFGYSIERKPGVIYHLNHKIKENSYFYDMNEMINSYKEYIKISNLSRDELIKYIQTWDNSETL